MVNSYEKEQKELVEFIKEIEPSGFKLFNPKIGKHSAHIYKNIKKSLQKTSLSPSESLKSAKEQFKKAYEVFSCCNPEDTSKGDTNQGLVVGKVQSGKTTNFATLAAIAADNNYKIVIKILGTTHSLKDKNYQSLERIMGFNDQPSDYDLDWYPVSIGQKGGSGEDFREFGIDVSIDTLKNRIDSKGGSIARNHKSKVLFFYLLKKKEQLIKMKKVIKELSSYLGANAVMPVLIIDDEVDSFSPNGNKPGVKKSKTYSYLEKLKEASGKCGGSCTYVGYTATAQAILLAHYDSFLKPRFHAVLNPGKGYVGNKEIFGISHHALTELEIKKKINEKVQPKIIDVSVNPSPNNPNPKNTDRDQVKMLNTLTVSVADFLISCSFLFHRREAKSSIKEGGDNHPPMSMMLLESLKNDPQEFWASKLEDILEGFKIETSNINSKTMLMNYLLNAYQEKLNIADSNFPMPSWDSCVYFINNVLNNNDYQIELFNQRGSKTIDTDTKSIWFWVGGIKLNRGFVVDGLLTTWFPLEPGNLTKDVTEQRGRFFGYKDEYIDLISIYLQKETFTLYRSYSLEEDEMHKELTRMAKDGQSLDQYDINFSIYDKFFKPTADNKNWSKHRKTSKTWHVSQYSPFSTNKQGSVLKNPIFHSVINDFLNSYKLRGVNSKNRFGASSNSSEQRYFKLGRFNMDDIYTDLLEPLIPSLDDRDIVLDNSIKRISDIYTKKLLGNFNCDIVYFPNRGGGSGISIAKSIQHPKNLSVGFTESGYAPGRGGNYVGDDKVILGTKFDPVMHPFDEEGNTNFTIQIHKIKKIKWYIDENNDDKLHFPLPNDILSIRIKHPGPEKSIWYSA